MTLVEAAKAGISKLRKSIWVLEGDHLEIVIFEDGGIGCWAKLHSPVTEERCGIKSPQTVMIGFDTDSDWEPWHLNPALSNEAEHK